MDELTKYALYVLKSQTPRAKIAIIGGGIYGCHNAFMLAKEGFDVTLFDKEDKLFAGASGYCAFRIHRGYHYPRSQRTRDLCALDHDLFMEMYGHLTRQEGIEKIFLISSDGRSNIDYGTFVHVMNGDELPMDPVDMKAYGFKNSEGAFMASEEPMLYADYPREWFERELIDSGCKLLLGEEKGYVKEVCDSPEGNGMVAINGQSFDFAVNCTYNQAFSYSPRDYTFRFELCLVPVAALKEGQEPLSFGVFDGPFPSIEPYNFLGPLPARFAAYEGRQLYQIWHVKHIVWKRYDDAQEAWKALKEGLSEEDVAKGVADTMLDLRKFYPKFDDRFEVVGHNLAIKTMVSSASSTRPLIVVNDKSIHPRFFTIFSSKLSSVFSASQELLIAMIRSHASATPPAYVESFFKTVAINYKEQEDKGNALFDDAAHGGQNPSSSWW
eukprot:CAMPEP_0119314900 /NCGR_PEP_ID=MMETSP1333-20130426/34087_1 /TAXON_ID=418940 /ORGANISM="Scyphosphaera apsteinii, Strain RCC1455" /LENGTH=439 /DNA_ID=CAMNT_0007320101 /DNA_START=404 /DNA_END=1723 /DNA_ORIENTATION=-